jgi:hypothetical protein
MSQAIQPGAQTGRGYFVLGKVIVALLWGWGNVSLSSFSVRKVVALITQAIQPGRGQVAGHFPRGKVIVVLLWGWNNVKVSLSGVRGFIGLIAPSRSVRARRACEDF